MQIRIARKEDVSIIVKMLADDELGKQREQYEDPLPSYYYDAYDKISTDPNQELVVIENDKHNIIGTLQLSFIQYLTYRGGVRAQVEAVRVSKKSRGQGAGRALLLWAISRARERKAHVIQLTTDKKRTDAKRFYEDLGFTDSHEGMKLHL